MQPKCQLITSSSRSTTISHLFPPFWPILGTPPSLFLSVNSYCSPCIVVGCNCVNKSVPTYYLILKPWLTDQCWIFCRKPQGKYYFSIGSIQKCSTSDWCQPIHVSSGITSGSAEHLPFLAQIDVLVQVQVYSLTCWKRADASHSRNESFTLFTSVEYKHLQLQIDHLLKMTVMVFWF